MALPVVFSVLTNLVTFMPLMFVPGFMGKVWETIAIVVILVLNATIGVVQGYRAEKAIEALRAMASPQARIVRDGTATVIPSADVVVGDLVLLDAGALVPADVRLTEAARLQVAEAALELGRVSQSSEEPIGADPVRRPVGDRRYGATGTHRSTEPGHEKTRGP